MFTVSSKTQLYSTMAQHDDGAAAEDGVTATTKIHETRAGGTDQDISVTTGNNEVTTVMAVTEAISGMAPRTATIAVSTAPTLHNDDGSGSLGRKHKFAPEPPYIDVPRDNDVKTNDADPSTASGA